MAHILIVGIDTPLITLLRHGLNSKSFTVEEIDDGGEALARIRIAPPDLLLLDWTPQGTSGVEICCQLRRHPASRTLPIIMLADPTQDHDTVLGLDAGADYVVTKPLSTVVLVARIRALLRRFPALPPQLKLDFHDISMDLRANQVQRNGRMLSIGPTEFRVLELFLRHPMRVFSREEVRDAIWGSTNPVEFRTVDVAILRLRKAINGPGEKDLVRTVCTAGYALDGDAAPFRSKIPPLANEERRELLKRPAAITVQCADRISLAAP
jgi:two-component system phosphate regulon response regulator PhoB